MSFSYWRAPPQIVEQFSPPVGFHQFVKEILQHVFGVLQSATRFGTKLRWRRLFPPKCIGDRRSSVRFSIYL